MPPVTEVLIPSGTASPCHLPLGTKGRLERCQKTKKDKPQWLVFFSGAGDEARTRYLHLGKVALYRMSYTRISNAGFIITKNPRMSRAIFTNSQRKNLSAAQTIFVEMRDERWYHGYNQIFKRKDDPHGRELRREDSTQHHHQAAHRGRGRGQKPCGSGFKERALSQCLFR